MSFGTVRDTLGRLKYNRDLLKGKRDRHANTHDAYFKHIEPKYKSRKTPNQRINKKALEAIKARVNRTKKFEMLAFSLIALVIIAFVIWLFI